MRSYKMYQLEKVIQFIEETDDILVTLMRYAKSQKATREQIAHEWSKFGRLLEDGRKNNITNIDLFYKQGRALVEAFKLFDDIVPELRDLK